MIAHNLYFFSFYAFFAGLSIFDFFNKDNKIRLGLLFFSIGFLSLIVGFRGRIGKDYNEYIRIFNESGSLLELILGTFDHTTIHGEPLFLFINMSLNTFGAEFYIMFFSFALISLSVNHFSIQKYSPYVFLSILIYLAHAFLYKELTQIRAGLAASVLLFGIQYLQNKEFKKYFLIVITATLFHSGAILAFLIYFFNKFDFRKRTLFIFIFGSIFLYLLGFFNNSLVFLQNLGILPERAVLYLTWDKYLEPLGLLNPTTVKQILVSLFFIYYKDFFEENLPYFKAMFYSYLFSTIWLIAVADFGIFAGRIAAYFSFVEVILIPSTILLIKSQFDKFIVYVLIIVYALLLAYINLVEKQILRPFFFFFEKATY